LSDVAERPDEIDLARAERARERAEKRLKSGSEEVDFRRAELKMQRAMIRIQLAGKGY
jgi:F-type H+-transporting ATPase subunit epsilon